MIDILYSIGITLATLAVLVAVHEFGHFWVARRCGIKVLRFSIGFGKPLLRWRDSLDTEYAVAAIPLGGYVKMLDEREGEVDPAEQHLAFNRKPVLSRIAVVVAGPLANFLLAIVAYWALFIAGESGYAPVIGAVETGSVAEVAGLEPGQEIVAIDGRKTPTWQAVSFRLLDRIGDTGAIRFSVRYPESDVIYDSQGELNRWLAGDEEPDLLGGLGLTLYMPPVVPLLHEVVAGSPAERAGLQPGDRILSTDGVAMELWEDWVDYVRARPGEAMRVSLERDGTPLELTLTPEATTTESGEVIGRVGVGVVLPEMPESQRREFHRGPLEALGAGAERTADMIGFTVNSMVKMVQGLISPKNLSGPITIAKVATTSAKSGLESYIGFLALLSVSLGVLNLLPIPVLDGGHLLYYSIELVVGKPVPERVQMVGYQIGLLMVVSLMVFALYNDFSRLS
ncbi:putative metallo peptidase [Congregibacter litoralis KT71]|uniref:Zinc metalloprotease n=1 Tax=Congregibacter litoralis KT71 TaxID=314285 RepID=A4ACZ6_9GAMM|nr:putative metallo peptidase [Congregibacter litoralis KT71]